VLNVCCLHVCYMPVHSKKLMSGQLTVVCCVKERKLCKKNWKKPFNTGNLVLVLVLEGSPEEPVVCWNRLVNRSSVEP